MNTLEVGRRITLKNILFATDFSQCSNAALSYALSLARRYGATIHAAHVIPTANDLLFVSDEAWPAAAEEEDRRIRGYIEELDHQLAGVAHDVRTPKGKVVDVLLRMIKENDVDLVITGTHGRTGVRKLLLGSVAEEIFRRCPCPVFSVGPHVQPAPGNGSEFHHVLFTTDFSNASLTALPYAISVAEEDQAQLTLLNVVLESEKGLLHPERLRMSLMRRLGELVPPEAELWCHPECEIEFSERFVSPAETILEIAKSKAVDLIVLGTRAAGSGAGIVAHLASTTARILTKAPCPVLLVRG